MERERICNKKEWYKLKLPLTQTRNVVSCINYQKNNGHREASVVTIWAQMSTPLLESGFYFFSGLLQGYSGILFTNEKTLEQFKKYEK